ncbi:hypothetical protein OHB39_38270, partial [Streptomyces sp. NBC_00047]|uniref:hypothetical protein n=1 Tax=Streptomyces sp. NBC_00047 TaxID=2975627 RepID=UPI00224D2540
MEALAHRSVGLGGELVHGGAQRGRDVLDPALTAGCRPRALDVCGGVEEEVGVAVPGTDLLRCLLVERPEVRLISVNLTEHGVDAVDGREYGSGSPCSQGSQTPLPGDQKQAL